MLPSREQAEALLKEAERCNPGPWVQHSRIAARCAERIAAACPDMDAEKAYILGLLHDIGRKFGARHLGHVSDGYSYMTSLGYDEAARVCLTHSFHDGTTDLYIGKFDTTEEELQTIRSALGSLQMDAYDRLIQLCDAISGSEGVLDMEERMRDVERRYGYYPQEKWDANLALKASFEKETGKDLYAVVSGCADDRVEAALDYLRLTYHPHTILLYGSYADGSFDEYSDLDCLLIANQKPIDHDDGVVAGVQMDCWLYTDEEARTLPADTFLPVYDALILKDDGMGARLKERVRSHVSDHAKTDEEEKRLIRSWIRKTLRRMEKEDDEARFRGVALMSQSLPDYFALRDVFYFGSKKAIRWIRENDPAGYSLLGAALEDSTRAAVSAWAQHVMG